MERSRLIKRMISPIIRSNQVPLSWAPPITNPRLLLLELLLWTRAKKVMITPMKTTMKMTLSNNWMKQRRNRTITVKLSKIRARFRRQPLNLLWQRQIRLSRKWSQLSKIWRKKMISLWWTTLSRFRGQKKKLRLVNPAQLLLEIKRKKKIMDSLLTMTLGMISMTMRKKMKKRTKNLKLQRQLKSRKKKLPYPNLMLPRKKA